MVGDHARQDGTSDIASVREIFVGRGNHDLGHIVGGRHFRPISSVVATAAKAVAVMDMGIIGSENCVDPLAVGKRKELE